MTSHEGGTRIPDPEENEWSAAALSAGDDPIVADAAEAEALAALLAVAAGPAITEELNGLEDALRAFNAQAAANEKAARTRRYRGLYIGIGAAAGVLALGAGAAYANVLPTPIQKFAHETIGAPSPDERGGGTPGGDGSGNGREGTPGYPGTAGNGSVIGTAPGQVPGVVPRAGSTALPTGADGLPLPLSTTGATPPGSDGDATGDGGNNGNGVGNTGSNGKSDSAPKGKPTDAGQPSATAPGKVKHTATPSGSANNNGNGNGNANGNANGNSSGSANGKANGSDNGNATPPANGKTKSSGATTPANENSGGNATPPAKGKPAAS